MAIKKYHVSKNLIPEIRGVNGWVIGYRQQNNGAYVSINNNGEWLSPKISISSGDKITISAMTIRSSSMTVYFWNGDNYISSASRSDYSGSTFTAPEGTTQMDFAIRAGADKKTEEDVISSGFWVMLNTGSTALPYEPYGNAWQEIGYKKYGTSTDTLTTLPADLYADGTNATVGLVGNMQQNGLPSPSSIIIPQECGERTGNLFDYQTMAVSVSGYYLKESGEEQALSGWRISDYIPCNGIEFTINKIGGNSPAICLYDENKQFLTGKSYQTGGTANKIPITISSATTAKYIRFSYVTQSDNLSEIMITDGSSVPSEYILYGYEIPILSASTTTPVYLGDVESTRIIGKYEVTGNESWSLSGSGYFYSTNAFSNYNHKLVSKISTKWSHYIAGTNNSNGQHLPNGYACLYCHATSAIASEVYIRDETYSTAEDFKTYLQQQYANGTPVTVWYVLATPTTGIVNEPIRKIGDYADEVSGITIPTIAGANTISVDTTLQPSEVTVNYKGWHPVQSVHEKSINLAPPFSDWVAGYIDVNGNIHNPSNPSAEKSSDFIEVSPNTDYTFSYETGTFPSVGETYAAWRAVCQYDKNKNSLGRTGGIGNDLTFTTASNCKYVRLSYRTYSQTKNTMLNTGSTALPYEPYWT